MYLGPTERLSNNTVVGCPSLSKHPVNALRDWQAERYQLFLRLRLSSARAHSELLSVHAIICPFLCLPLYLDQALCLTLIPQPFGWACCYDLFSMSCCYVSGLLASGNPAGSATLEAPVIQLSDLKASELCVFLSSFVATMELA